MAEQVYLAADLGASGGRVLAGAFDGRRLRLEELHRFDNGAVSAGSGLYWDVLGLWTHICHALRMAAGRYRDQVRSVGVDAWGVDFALLGRKDVILGNPSSYRDPRTEGVMEQALHMVPREEIFARTGVQFMPFNTLYQLLAMRLENSPLLEVAEHFLMMPDLFHWLLTGVKTNEFTNATTTQFFDPARRAWAKGLLAKLQLPTHILGEIVQPGAAIGPISRRVAADTGLAGVQVVAPGTHDTASAVMAVPAAEGPAERPKWCYLSSGTWSLMGAEVPAPVIDEASSRLNFTNEGGVGGSIRLLKNITGLWIVQECRRAWANAGREFSWDELTRLAAAAPPLRSTIVPDHPSFATPGDMPARIREFCRQTNQPVPENEGAIVRCALESLALRYRQVLGWLEELIGGRLETIHVVGGGVQNRQLCQFTADACQRRVLAGPKEATALGNLMMQAMAAGAVGSIREARQAIANSFKIDEYLPQAGAAWDQVFGKFVGLTG